MEFGPEQIIGRINTIEWDMMSTSNNLNDDDHIVIDNDNDGEKEEGISTKAT